MLKREVVDLMPKLLVPYFLRGRDAAGHVEQLFPVLDEVDVELYVKTADDRLRWEVSN